MKLLFKIVAILVILIAIIVEKSMGNTSAILAASYFKNFFLEMIVFLPFMFVLVGLVDIWLPRSLVEPHIGKDSGVKGIFWIIILAMLQAGPLYGAFPVATVLWKKGASIRNIFIYLGAFSTIKIPMLTFEVAFLGWKFSLLRTVITLHVFIAIAYFLEFLLTNKNFYVREIK